MYWGGPTKVHYASLSVILDKKKYACKLIFNSSGPRFISKDENQIIISGTIINELITLSFLVTDWWGKKCV